MKKNNKINLIEGVFLSTSKGFGFVKVGDGEKEIFIHSSKTLNAMNGDTVLVELDFISLDNSRKDEGKIIKILEHATNQIIGVYKKNKSFGFVKPDNIRFTRDIYIPKKKSLKAKTGDKVVVKIYDFGDKKRKPEGEIVEVLGNYKLKGVDILSIAKSFGLEEDFKKEVLEEAHKIKEEALEEDKVGRVDFRNLLTITIDSEDAKDLDDAITLEIEENNYILGVHIADVTHYVRENSFLDKEALERGTSTYLVDRVIPMLPKKLSNGICSLNEGKDRLTLSCIMKFDKKAKLLDYYVVESIINVDYRLSYNIVNNILVDKDSIYREKYHNIISVLNNMADLSKILRENRHKRGAIDFDFPESKVILDKKGKAIDIQLRERNIATKLIEDFMLAANEVIAEYYFWQSIPFLYRIHERPDEEKMKSLAVFINNFGLIFRTKNNEYTTKDLQKLLDKLEGTKEEIFLNRIILKSMKKAVYSDENLGHFGLASKYYTHFTSPIRRYPDLQIHRIIKESLNSKLSKKRIEHYERILKDVAYNSSLKERQAEEAERDSLKYKKCEYMSKFIGTTYEGIISSVTKFGIYVELENTVEGLVHISNIKDDYYAYIENEYRLLGEKTGRSYRIGEKVLISVEAVDKLSRTIDFLLIKKL